MPAPGSGSREVFVERWDEERVEDENRPLTRAGNDRGMADARIGALHFEFIGAGRAVLPSLEGDRWVQAGELELAVHDECGEQILVVDHRLHAADGTPSRVELWQCTERPEVPLSYLVVLADARARADGAGRSASLSDVVHALLPLH